MSERTAQVSLMSDIYRKAAEVWIWLGEEDSTSRQAMVLFKELIDPDFCWPDIWWGHSQFVAICRIMNRPWFRRGWVIQEAAFAKVATFFCGDRRLDLATFRAVVAKIHIKIRQDMASQNQTDTTSFQRFVAAFYGSPATKLFEILDQTFDKTAGPSEWRRNLSLENLVGASTYTNTTDQRDTVYSLLNLAKDVVPCLVPQMGIQQSIVPDYEKNTLEVYADFILHCSRSGSIDIICRPWAPLPVDQPRPTWLRYRDFSPFGDPSQPSDLQRHARPLVGTAGQRRLYNCDNNSIPQLLASSSHDGGTFDGSLSIRGVILGEIIRASMRMANAIITKECLEILRLSPSYLDPTLELIDPAIWRTLCADRDKEGNPAPRSYASAFARLLKESSQSGADAEPAEVWDGFAIIDIEDRVSSDALHEHINYLEVVRDTVWNRRTCRLKSFRRRPKRLVGLIPQHARVGDQVCILYGCSVPVVLREVVQEAGVRSWHIIGDAYIDRMMNGEALDGRLEERNFRIC
ncbi:hypothetical protein G7054_g12127 [Neopestalotiopsis clavispora]|nr:hypothetical protein G7054_g12127 [Neopestalotiopsis clavispora]